MKIIASTVEPDGPGRIKVTTTIELSTALPEGAPPSVVIGDGPSGDAIPDKIVRALIGEMPTHSLSADQLKRRLGGNPATVNRQAWTLAANAPDLQRRLRGWVVSPERGLYALSDAARAIIEQGRRY